MSIKTAKNIRRIPTIDNKEYKKLCISKNTFPIPKRRKPIKNNTLTNNFINNSRHDHKCNYLTFLYNGI